MAGDALKRRLLSAAMAALCTSIGLLLAVGFSFNTSDRYLALSVAWFSAALALVLEPSARASVRLTLLAAGGAALGGALLTLGVMLLREQSWDLPGTGRSLGALLGFIWSADDAARVVLVLLLATLPAPLTLLVVRRGGRQVEWQALAAALGPVFVGIALFPGELLTSSGLLLLLLSGLPFGFGAYLLDRRLLGPDAVACFPEQPAQPVAIAPVPPLEAAPAEAALPEPAPAEPAPSPVVTRSPWSAPLAVIPLAFALVLGPAWALVVGRAGFALAPSGTFPGQPELTALFDEVASLQEEHRARTGSYAPTLGALEALPLDVRGGATRGYVLRYARSGDAGWVLTADPIPARPGWPSLRKIGPRGELERSRGAFSLAAEAP